MDEMQIRMLIQRYQKSIQENINNYPLLFPQKRKVLTKRNDKEIEPVKKRIIIITKKEPKKKEKVSEKLKMFENLDTKVIISNPDNSKCFFKEIEQIFFDILLKSKIKKEKYQNLNRNQKIILLGFVVRMKKQKSLYNNFSEDMLEYQKVKNLIQKVPKKRNEELLKCGYKIFLKMLYRKFQKKDCEQLGRGQSVLKGIKNKDKTKIQFYLFLFKDLIDSRKFHIDLILDICNEKTLNKKGLKPELFEDNNWRHKSKYLLIKKISSEFRYLVSQDTQLRKKFENYFKNKTSFFKEMKSIIGKKVKMTLNKWRQIQEDEPDVFFRKILESINSEKFKAPWSMDMYNRVQSFCLDDLENPVNKEIFNAVKKDHYRYKRAK